jgi:hypothetical protein
LARWSRRRSAQAAKAAFRQAEAFGFSLGAVRFAPAGRLPFTCHQAAMGVAGQQAKENTMTDTNATKGSKPTYSAYHVRDRGDGGKAFWTHIGFAWAHGDGKGFNIQVDVVPLDGRINLRVAGDKKD